MGLSCITGYLKDGELSSLARLDSGTGPDSAALLHGSGKRGKVEDGCSDLEFCALWFALVLPEVSLGKQHSKSPLHLSWVS